MVTIGPVFLLGLLGVTFYLGSRRTKPSIAEAPIITARSRRPSSSMENSVQVFPKVGGIGDQQHHPTYDAAHPAVSPSASRRPALGSGGVTSSQDPPTKVTNATHGREPSWMIHVSEDAAGESGQPNAVSASGPVERPILASVHSLRRMWQTGAGNDMDAKQVCSVAH